MTLQHAFTQFDDLSIFTEPSLGEVTGAVVVIAIVLVLVLAASWRKNNGS